MTKIRIDKEQDLMIRKLIKQCVRDFNVNTQITSKFGEPTRKQNLKYRIEVLRQFPEIKKGQNIFDIGVGWGPYLFPLAQLNKGVNFYALEPPKSPWILKSHFIRKLKKNNIKLYKADITKDRLPFKDNFFDAILFSEVIEHIQPLKLDFVLNEIKRILKKNGMLIITTPNILSLVHRIKFLFGHDFDWDINPAPTLCGTYSHVREYSLKELKTIFTKKDFKIMKIKFLNISYGLWFLDFINNILSSFLQNFRNNIVIVLKKVS